MRFLQLIPVKLSIGLTLGICLGFFFKIDVKHTLLAALFCFSFLGILYRTYRKKVVKNSLFGLISLLCMICIGVLSITIQDSAQHPDFFQKQSITRTTSINLQITEVLSANTYNYRYTAKITGISSMPAQGFVFLSIPKTNDSVELTVDTIIEGYGALNEIKEPVHSFDFNFKYYAKTLGITDQLYLNSNSFVIKKPTTSSWYGKAQKLRKVLLSKLDELPFGNKEREVLKALVLGERRTLDLETKKAYTDAGAIHILALSGLHIGLLLWFLNMLLSPLKKLKHGKYLILMLSVIALWFFAFITGLSASVVRAVTMFSFVAYALFLNRPTSALNTLALAYLFTLLVQPLFLFQVGFQLSYCAVFAIVWFQPKFSKIWQPKTKVMRYIWALLTVSMAAQLGVLPVSLFYFHQFPGLFFISNLLILPWLGIILFLGFVILIWSSLGDIPNVIITSYNTLIYTMNSCIQWIASQDIFVFKYLYFDTIQLLLFIIFIICFGNILYSNKKRIVFAGLIAVIGIQCYTTYLLISSRQIKEAIILHRTRESLLLVQNGTTATLYGAETLPANMEQNLRTKRNIDRIQFSKLKHHYNYGKTPLIVIDSSGIYTHATAKNSIILLTNSPKLNLDRLIEMVQPSVIIADGSNYPNSVTTWAKTCAKKKLPFHDTREKGAYTFKYVD